MKFRIISILLTALVLTGCGQDRTLESNFTTEVSTESQTQAGSENQGENAAQETESTEPYVLTFEASTMDGETMTSDCFADSRLTMLNVWATYCNPCLNEMPDLGEIATEYDKADFQMIGIISDVSEFSEEDALTTAKDLIEQTGAATYPHLPLNQSLYSNLVGAVDSVPTTFFINQKGELLGYIVGAQSKETWEGIIDELLAEME